MNRLLTVLLIAALASLASADSINLKKAGASYVYTVPHKGPVELGSVMFALPVASTNTFTISATRDIVERTLVGSQITTNLYNRIETNTNYGILSEAHTVLTNLMFSITTTNITTTQVYDYDNHLPAGFQLTEGDKLIYTWSDTNTFWFIQNIITK